MIDRQINMINRQDRWTRQIDMMDMINARIIDRYDGCIDTIDRQIDRQIDRYDKYDGQT